MRTTISGAQSTGKSTLINNLFSKIAINQNYQLCDETTRNLIRNNLHLDFGPLKINEDGTDITQQLICAQHLINYTIGHNKNTIYDRCALDGFVYTTYLYELGRVNINTLSISRSIFVNTKYDIMFYIRPEFPIVKDGERSINNNFRDKICELFDEYIKSYNLKMITLTGTVENRTKQVMDTLKSYTLERYKNAV